VTDDSDTFEELVASLFRGLGGRVAVKQLLGGKRVDLLVEESTLSGIPIRVAVECKKYSQRVGKDVVQDSARDARELLANHHVDRAVMVTTVGYTEPARDAAKESGLGLLVVADLEAQQRLHLSAVSEPLAAVLRHARRLGGYIRDALGSADDLTSFDWEDIHGNVSKAVTDAQRVSSGALVRRDRVVDRRAYSAMTRICEEAGRCLDAVWFLRQVIRLGEETLSGSTAALSERTAADISRLRELDAARAQLRQRLSRLDELALRVDRPAAEGNIFPAAHIEP
jgi:hypothetical protein